MAYIFENTQLGMQPIADTVLTAATTSPKPWKYGDIVRAVDPDYGVGEFIYLKGLDATAVGSWVVYDLDTWTTTLAVADAVGPVAIAMSANLTGYSGWYQISGKAVGKVLSGFADNGVPYLTSTDGSVDDTAVAGDYVHNAQGASAIGTPSAGLAEFHIARPWVDNNVDDLDVS